MQVTAWKYYGTSLAKTSRTHHHTPKNQSHNTLPASRKKTKHKDEQRKCEHEPVTWLESERSLFIDILQYYMEAAYDTIDGPVGPFAAAW